MTKLEYKTYFENLARKSTILNHDPENKKKSFFYITDPYNTTALDNAIRNSVSYPAMLLDVPSGMIDDNAGNNFTDIISGQFRIVAKTDKDNPIEQVQDACFNLGKAILYKMQTDSRTGNLLPGKQIRFQMEDIPYEPIGPMAIVHYGYVFTFRFICPFSWSVDSAIWRDI